MRNYWHNLDLAEKRQLVYLAMMIGGATLTTFTSSIWWLALSIIAVLLHMMFRDTMNQFQWFPFWGGMRYRLYWYARDNADTNSRNLWMGYIFTDIFGANRETVMYFYGHGPHVRFGRYSFQVGVGQLTHENPWARPLDTPVEDIRKGHEGVWEQDDATASS